IYITENGVSTEDDSRRIEYIDRALAGLKRCIADGIDVRGYIHWSLLDNFGWIFGYLPKFGLIAVNRETQERLIKPSARHLGEIARANALSRVAIVDQPQILSVRSALQSDSFAWREGLQRSLAASVQELLT